MMAHDEPFPGSPDDMMNMIARLRAENAQLRTMIVDALRAMKEIELVLRKALDKDRE